MKGWIREKVSACFEVSSPPHIDAYSLGVTTTFCLRCFLSETGMSVVGVPCLS